ncbi:hypothetical protein VCRA2110O318_290037 [Vibrio crassostreae]|nr:hypothetical protein VCRA2117O328_280037 [Vibrio crassostreae]CAK2313643.1 hypothetical protein VCRA2110O318_290037 [Vibrio crassostreae]CAK2451475.1 hypothetical protein VCRA2110O319_220048 [Vibrio crassostreae]CAK2769950.1 hypothetical protein VCRA217O317_220039 [Vibrio crassostreae]
MLTHNKLSNVDLMMGSIVRPIIVQINKYNHVLSSELIARFLNKNVVY